MTDTVVTQEEKKKIRRVYNSAGCALLVQYVLMIVLAMFGYMIASPFMKEEFDSEGLRIIGFAEASVMFCTPALASIAVFFFYYLIKGEKVSPLFDSSGVSGRMIAGTVGICFLMHQAAYPLQLLTLFLLTSLDLGTPELDYVLAQDAPTSFMNVFTSVVLAPIAEEMLYRGILLKETARVSKRFGIVFSAVMFGLMHGNPYQLILGTMIGLVLGYVTVKSRSLIPAIVGHMAVNAMASVPEIAMYFSEELYTPADMAVSAFEIAVGLIVLVKVCRSGGIKLPEYNSYHKKRTIPVMITSLAMVLMIIIYLFDIKTCVQPLETEELEEMQEAIKTILISRTG